MGGKIKGKKGRIPVGNQYWTPFALKEGIQFPEVQEELDKHAWQIYLLFQLPGSISSRPEHQLLCLAWQLGRKGVGGKGPFWQRGKRGTGTCRHRHHISRGHG